MLAKKRNKQSFCYLQVPLNHRFWKPSQKLWDPMCRTAHREELRKLERGHCQSLSSFGFHHPNYFSVNIESVAKGFHWTIWYHSVIAPVTIYHPLKTEERCLNPNLISCQYSCGGKVSRIHLVSQLPSAAEPADGTFSNMKCNTSPLQREIWEQLGQSLG